MNMKAFINIILLSLLTLVFISGCSSSKDSDVKRLQIGTYSFTMKDSSGKKLVDGNIVFESMTKGNLSGKYEFTKKYVDNFEGMNTMTGSFSGNYDSVKSTLSLNMNPKIADANVYINASVYKSTIVGDWSYSTMVGVKNKGTFKARFVE